MPPRQCSLEGCDRPRHAHGYCEPHYLRWKRHGDPGPAEIGRKRPRTGTCEGPECGGAVIADGLCSAHYEQRRAGKPLTPKRRYKPRGVPCEVERCERPAQSEGLCQTHYNRRLRGEADWARAIPPKASNGSGHTDKRNGYRYVQHNGRQTREHRVVMEGIVGRPLLPHETVHHRNGARADNRPENLELWSSMQPAGQAVVDKVAFAREILALYGTDEERALVKRQSVTRPA